MQDEVTELPNNFGYTMSYTGFDRDAHILTLQLQHNGSGHEVLFLNLGLPGYEHFSYKKSNSNMKKRKMDFTENLCSSTRLNVTSHQPMGRWRIRFRDQ